MSYLNLSGKKLKTLEGLDIPEIVTGDLLCNNNQLTSLEFGPNEVKLVYYCACNQLTSLEFCATKIWGALYTHENLITNLRGIHLQFKNGYINGTLNIEQNPLKSHLLGVILIPILHQIIIDNNEAERIINKHLDAEKDILECQEELIQNGFKEFAQL